MSRPVVFDTNTEFGFPGAALDSGLALLYLLGCGDVEIKGITVAEDPAHQGRTFEAVSWLLRLNSRTDIPVVQGCSGNGDLFSPASDFLVRTSRECRGELSVITTGPLGNIYAAAKTDPEFYSRLQELICTGGLFYPPQVPGWKPPGDNAFSLDPPAAEAVLNQAPGLVLMSRHLGIQVPMTIDELFIIRDYNVRLYYLVKEYLVSDACRNVTGKASTFLWSLLPAVYLENRELFHKVKTRIRTDKSSLKNGILEISETGNPVTLPDYITDIDEFFKRMHRGWEQCPFRNWPGTEKSKVSDSQ